MPLNFDPLEGEGRILIEAELKPIQGDRFQPTGFPNLGAATYKNPDGQSMILVESAQSMANRLESAVWNGVADTWIDALHGLPYVEVLDSLGSVLTNSVLEAHRLNSAYIAESEWFTGLKSEIGVDEKTEKPLDMRAQVFPLLMKYDPGSLIHGVFLEKVTGVARSPRAVSAFIEARGIEVVASGGVKNDRVRAAKGGSGGTAAEGYGNVPFARDEFAAERITAYFNVDLDLIRGFGLGPTAERLLIALALYKIVRFLSSGMRLRTACDLESAASPEVKRPGSFSLPSLSELEGELPSLIAKATEEGLFASPTTTRVTWSPKARARAVGSSVEADS